MATYVSHARSSSLKRTWWVYADDESPCAARCDPAHSLDDDGVWRCGCGTWDVVAEKPAAEFFPGLNMWSGQTPWGDLWYDTEELPRLRSLTAAQREAEKSAFMTRITAGLVDEHLRKVESLYCDRSGNLKQDKLVLRRCKWDDTPAGNGFVAGCAAHHKGKCPWVHKDQQQLLAQLKGVVGGRDFTALSNKKKY
jgi:hypothetical protein